MPRTQLALMLITLFSFHASGCAIYYRDSASGAEHNWEIGHLATKITPPTHAYSGRTEYEHIIDHNYIFPTTYTYLQIFFHILLHHHDGIRNGPVSHTSINNLRYAS